MNVEVAVVAGLTVLAAGVLGDRPWPAADLLKAFSVEELPADRGAVQRRFARPPGLDRLPLPEDRLRLLVRVLAAEPGLAPVWNWQRNGVPLHGAG